MTNRLTDEQLRNFRKELRVFRPSELTQVEAMHLIDEALARGRERDGLIKIAKGYAPKIVQGDWGYRYAMEPGASEIVWLYGRGRTAERERDAARDALRELRERVMLYVDYVYHKGPCPVMDTHRPRFECTCGIARLQDAMEKAWEVLGDE